MSRQSLRALTPFVCSSCRSAMPLRPAFTRAISTTPTLAAKATSLQDQLGRTAAKTSGIPMNSDNTDISDAISASVSGVFSNPLDAARAQRVPPHRIHIYATKHNTHMTLTAPPPPKQRIEQADLYKPPEPNKPLMTYATGMIGFKKHHRSTYDAAFQLATYFLKQMQERALLGKIKQIEIVLRGFGSGREAATKVILGQEGRLIRNRIVAVTDATRLKFGGSRSPNPRRLG